MDMHIHTIKAGEFKTHCLEIMDTVNREKVEYIITKRGVPVARLIPVDDVKVSPFGYMKDTVVYMGDIIEPVDVAWGTENAEDTP